MIRVAVDAMGGDFAPDEIVRGAVEAISARDDLELYLVGREERIKQSLAGLDYPAGRVAIVNAPEVIEGTDDPGLAIRRKKDSSMVQALQMVRRGEADAAVSAGNTGALMGGGLLFLGRLGQISRPALLVVLPGFSGAPFVLLDAGANMDARPEQLVQYAHMGRIYAQQLLGIARPRTALLNVGTEPQKGNQQVKKAYALFAEHVPHFCGNIEGTGLFFNAADVVVCDGFVGNIVLKLTEGLSRGLLQSLKEEFTASARYRAGALLLKPALYRLRDKFDDTAYGGAPLGGVNGLCIKCHGSSKARSIEQALLKQVYPFVKNRVLALFEEALLHMPSSKKEAD